MQKIVKKQTGITLIALVITIIVLLILAGVSIATLTGNNGILKQANTAKENNKVATAKERVQLEAAGSFDNTGVFSKTIFKDNLKKNLGLTDSDIVDISHMYSKDIEHLEENIEKLAEIFEINDVFKVEEIINVLIN